MKELTQSIDLLMLLKLQLNILFFFCLLPTDVFESLIVETYPNFVHVYGPRYF